LLAIAFRDRIRTRETLARDVALGPLQSRRGQAASSALSLGSAQLTPVDFALRVETPQPAQSHRPEIARAASGILAERRHGKKI